MMSLYLSTTWGWKTEPESPAMSDVSTAEDVWLLDEQRQEDNEELSQPNSRSQTAARLLSELDEWVKEEPFSDWLEEKINLPIFEDIPPVDVSAKYKSFDTETLLQEFEDVYGEVELNNNGALTPPQSPPTIPQYVPELQELTPVHPKKITYHQDNNVVLLNSFLPQQKPSYSVSYVDDMILLDEAPTPQPDVAREMAVVDELVRIRAEGMDVSSDPWETDESILSPPDSSSDGSSCAFGESSTDPEWVPEAASAPKAAPPLKRKRGKPYGRPVEDKRLRKKEQNKNAATRYRQKKKQEVEVILDEEKGLEDKNSDLNDKVTDLQREIKYLKGLMRDLFKAKGLLK